jgi:hypothetical protein
MAGADGRGIHERKSKSVREIGQALWDGNRRRRRLFEEQKNGERRLASPRILFTAVGCGVKSGRY